MDSKRAGGAMVARPLFQVDEGGSIPTSALQLQFVTIDMRTAMELNAKWHSMLPRKSAAFLGALLCGNMSIAYAAEFENQFYAVAIWSQPVARSYCDGHTIELRRLAICEQAPKFTASRMLGVMRRLVVRDYAKETNRQPYIAKPMQIRKLVSYLAVDVHTGTIYRRSAVSGVFGKQTDSA